MGKVVRNEAAIRDIAERASAGLGVEVVDCRFGKQGGRLHIRINIDRPGADGVGIKDCQNVSRAMEREIEEHDAIDCSYLLEVSSPGLDRPILSSDDVRRNVGRLISVHARDEQGRDLDVRGTLMEGDAERWVVRLEDGRLETIARERIVVAKQDVSFR